jgi:hypothetical protein
MMNKDPPQIFITHHFKLQSNSISSKLVTVHMGDNPEKRRVYHFFGPAIEAAAGSAGSDPSGYCRGRTSEVGLS